MGKRLRVKVDPIRAHYWLRIKERRIIANLSQEELAKRSRMHKLSIKHYESGKVEPSLQALVQLVVGLGLSGLDEIIKIDQDSVRGVIADDIARNAPGPKETPVITPPPAGAAIPEMQPATITAEPLIGAAAVITETFVNPVGDMLKKAEADGETAK